MGLQCCTEAAVDRTELQPGELAAYFLGPYLDGRRPDRIAGYKYTQDPITRQHTLYFEAADIHVWADAVDMASPDADPATLVVLFHFTPPVRFVPSPAADVVAMNLPPPPGR